MRLRKKRNLSLFNFLVTLFVSAGVIVFFVYNIIVVNGLAVDNNNIKTEITKVVSVNNNLQTEIERLSNIDNIKPVAVDKLNLKFPVNKPKKVVINKSEFETVTQ
jgi:sensor domain CHASE-containing protein